MKKLITFSFIALTFFGSVQAQAFAILTPVFSVTGTALCFKGSGEVREQGCLTAAFAAPSSTTLMIALLKEDIAAVEIDAQAALAGEPATDALLALISDVRAQYTELAEVSDAEIIIFLLETLNS